MDTRSEAKDSKRRRRPRVWLVVAVSLFVLAFLVLLLGPLLIPTERLRAMAESSAEEALGRKVQIGSLRVRVLPVLSVLLRDVRISASEAATIETLAEAEVVRGRISPIPLLKRRVELSRVTVERGTIRLERLPDGSFAALELLDALERDTGTRWDLGLGRLFFRNVDVELVDRHVVPGQTIVTSGRDASGSVLLASVEYGIPVELDMALFGRPTWNLTVRGLLPRTPPPLADEEIPSHMRPARPIDISLRLFEVETAPLSPYLGTAADYLTSTFSLHASVIGDLSATVDVEGTLEMTPQLMVSLSGLVDFASEAPRAVIDATLGMVDLEHLLAAMPTIVESLPEPVDVSGRVRVSARITGPLDDLRIAGWLQSPGLRVAAGSFVVGPPSGAGLVIESDDAAASLDANIRGEGPMRLNLDLRSTRTVLDYRTGDGPPDEPLAMPDALINARLRMDSGRLLLLEFQDLDAHLRLHEGRMTLRPWLQAHQGSLRARLDSDLNRTPSSHRLELELIEMDAGSLTRQLLPDPDPPVTGVLSAELLVGWRGIDFEAFGDTALGQGTVALREGRIATLDLEPDIAEALRQVAETIGVLPPQEFVEPTLRAASGSFVISDGVLTTQVMEVRGREVRILLSGGLALDRALAISGSFAFSPEASDRFGPVGQVLRGPDGWLAVPFSVSGRVEDPEVSIDIPTLLGRAAEGLIGTPDVRWEELRRLWREHWAPPATPAG